MVDVADAAPAPGQAQPARRGSVRETLAKTEIDLRLFGMLVALAVILVGFHIVSGGTFLRPANMVTLAVQASGTAIMATGMVLVIVSRNIDLSVGSIVGVVAMVYALLQTEWLPAIGLGLDNPFQWIVALALGRRPRGLHRWLPGLHHRLRRRPVLHRHARRPALPARLGLAAVERRRGLGAAQQLPPDRRAARPVRSADS